MTDAQTDRPVLSGRYELHRRIARGGMADVFLARDQLLDRPVAVKVLFPQYAAEPTFVARFRREAQAAANLNHPSVVSVYDWGSHEDTYFIVMEYVEGRSLAEVLAAEGHLQPDRAVEIAIDVAAALGFAHRNGTVHRDVKPGNIMITPTGQVKVTDFGIARAFGGEDDELTQTGSVMGTASYFSPEQAQGKTVDPRSDLYSLGVVLFEMVAGEPPFTGASPVSIAYKHVQEIPPPVTSLNPSVPGPLEDIITRLLAKDPDERYPAADDVRQDLRRFRDGQPLAGTGPAPAPQNGTATTAFPAAAAGAAAAPSATRSPDTGSSRAVIDTTRALPASAAVRQVEPVEEYYEPPSRTGVFVIMLAGLLLLLVGLVVYITQAVGTGETDDTVADAELIGVPTLIGEPQRSAENRLTDLELRFDPVFAPNDQFEPGTVFDQDPEAGEEVEVDSVVTIFIVEAEEVEIVPNVVGDTREEATTELQDLGFTVKIEREASDTVELDRVIEQSLPPGQEANKGADVTLIVSTGPEQAVIPNLGGVPLSEANSQLNAAGFFNIQNIREASNDVPVDSVIRTEPSSGNQVDLSTPIIVYVSSGPDGNQAVPSVSNLSEQEATRLLQERGFRVRVQNVPVDPGSGQVGVVISSDPDGGQQAEPDSEVTIFVGRDNSSSTSTTAGQTTTTTQSEPPPSEPGDGGDG